MKTFVLIKRIPANPEYANKPSFEWWERQGKKLLNASYGYNNLTENDEVLETVEAKDWDELWTPANVSKTSTYKNLFNDSTNKSLKCGWLSPEGKMHYCQYHYHIIYVEYILNSDVPTIEEQGWLHIYDGVTLLHPKKRMTIEQARTAREELGLTVLDEDIQYQ